MKPQELSAEERLLQIIQSGGESPFPKERDFFGGFYKKIRSALYRGGSSSPRPKRAASSMPARLNRVIALSGVLVMALAVTNIFFFKPDIGRLHNRVAETVPIQEHPSLNLLPVEDYLASISGRSLFQPVTGEPEPKAALPAAASPSGSLEDLKLVGIAWGAVSEAMIREVKGGRTYFLKVGEKIKGILVKEILKDRVIVEYDGQIKELM